VKYVRQGGKKVEAAKRFGVCRATIYQWLALGDDLTPRKTGPKKAHKLDWEVLRKAVEKRPETMQKEWAREFGVSKTAIHYAMRRMKLTRKKNVEV
ncbi:MAG: helix-turn-helix domain-containing protein, partial [Alphaproteobacteria bacterium]|nr:helix-turn-helix domain-containing protein [Alphaproteobacteria bacterium]